MVLSIDGGCINQESSNIVTDTFIRFGIDYFMSDVSKKNSC